MVSQTAEADIQDLWDAGLRPTVSDIILLNALGLVVENSTNPYESMYHMRRCAWLGENLLKQPLLAHEIWLQKASPVVSEDVISQLAVNAYVCCTEPDDLPDPYDKTAVKKAVEDFLPKFGAFTQQQIASAVIYVNKGTDWRYGEEAPPNPKSRTRSYTALGEEFSIPVGVVLNGIAIGLGLTMKEALLLPRHTYQAMVERKLRYDGAYDKKRVKSENEDDYLRAFDEIRARLKKEKEQTDGR